MQTAEPSAAHTTVTTATATATSDDGSRPIKKTARKKLTLGQKAVKAAKKLRGVPYQAGGDDTGGFDCSGFTSYVYGTLGVKLTHNAQAQFYETKSVSKLKAGDLVFFGSDTGSITHVGIYVGDGKFIHSPQSGESVRVEKLSNRTNYLGATRPK